MIDYLKIYPDRLAKSEEIILDAMETGSEEEIQAAFALLGREFYAAMQYGFHGTEPNFPRRSVEGSEWRDWRSDVDRSEAKMQSMRELGSKGGNAKSRKSTPKQATAEKDIATAEKNVATLEENVATLEENVATLEKDIATVEENAETESDASENPSAKIKIKTKVNPKIKVKSKVKVEAKVEAENVTPTPQADAQTVGPPEDTAAATTTDESLRKLCLKYPVISSAGFRAEVRKDIDEYGEHFVDQALAEAHKANTRDHVSFNFYRSVRDRVIDDYVRNTTDDDLREVADGLRKRRYMTGRG